MEYINFEHNETAAELVRAAYDTPPLAFVHSYGCQQNVNDGERIKGVLVDIGYGLCDKPEDADLILFNTCAVREHAEQRVFGNVGALKGLKEKKRGLMIGLCGCMANQKHVVEKLRKSYPYVDLVFGVDGIDTLPQLIAQKLQKHKRVLMEPAQRPVIVENIPIRRESEFRAWLPIMYGCDNFCTYCIVPYVRGREKSRKPGDILAEFRGLVEAGYKEITLLGQNVNSYGKGLEEQVDFADLLNLLCAVPGDYQIRFMTSHPKDASHKLIDTIAAQPHLCKHLHLPVQCGSDELLKKMNRHYTIGQYMELIEYARKKVPGITFSSDIIVGFPGETEEDFQGTLELVKKVGYMQLFTFIYSKRTGTKAAEMPDPTPRKEKTDRMTRLLATQDEIAMALVKAQVGQTVRVLVEGFGRNEGTLSGRLDNNLTVEFAADPAMLGSYATVHLTGARATVLLGEVEAEKSDSGANCPRKNKNNKENPIMDCIDLFKRAAMALQTDPRYVILDQARKANDKDEELQNLIGEFNLARMDLNNEIGKNERDDARIAELNEKVNSLYGQIMGNEGMVAYNEAKRECENLVNYIDAIINTAMNGGDPMTVQEPSASCTGSCSTCGGCH